MYHVLAKETTVTIGARVFSPLLATTFADDLPAEVAERADLLHIEEVPDEQPVVASGGLTATGTLEVEAGEGGLHTQVHAPDPTILTDEALAGGVTVLNVGDDDDEGPGADPDPFADPTEGPVAPAGQTQGPAPKDALAGKGSRGGKK